MILRKKPINAVSLSDGGKTYIEYLELQFPQHRNYAAPQLQILTG